MGSPENISQIHKSISSFCKNPRCHPLPLPPSAQLQQVFVLLEFLAESAASQPSQAISLSVYSDKTLLTRELLIRSEAKGLGFSTG